MNLITVHYENVAKMDASSVNLASKESIKTAYADIFRDLGRMPGLVHLDIDTTVQPVITPPRRVPIAIKSQLKQELNCLLE